MARDGEGLRELKMEEGVDKGREGNECTKGRKVESYVWQNKREKGREGRKEGRE